MGVKRKAFLVVMALLFVSACGQKGPLVLPQKVQAPPVITPAEPQE